MTDKSIRRDIGVDVLSLGQENKRNVHDDCIELDEEYGQNQRIYFISGDTYISELQQKWGEQGPAGEIYAKNAVRKKHACHEKDVPPTNHTYHLTISFAHFKTYYMHNALIRAMLAA